jgi:phospholipid/cholesterol/gamma-HCH transport system substrate-binding protein
MRLASKNAVRGAGIAVILGLVLALYLSLTASTGLPGQSFRTVRADFDHVGGLREGDDVRTASVRIGQVRSITFEDGKARVEMKLDPDQDVYQDASAAIVARSALGQNFVMIDPGTTAAGQLPEEGQIADGAVSSPVNLDEVLSVLDPATRKAAANTIYETGTGAAGHSKDLADVLAVAPELLADLQAVAATLADPETDLDGLLQRSALLAGRFDGRTDHLGRLMGHLSTTVEALSVNEGAALDDTLEQAPSALDSTTTAMQDLRGPLTDLDVAMRGLLPGGRSLAQSTPALRAVLREGVGPLDKVPGVADQAVPTVEALTTAIADARPLADRLRATFAHAEEPTGVLAPYTPEFVRFFERWNSANQHRDKSGHYLRIYLVVRPESLTGSIPVRDPLVHRNPYPAPGTADSDRASTLLGAQ